MKSLLFSIWLAGAAFAVLFAGSEPTNEERTLHYPLPDELVTTRGRSVQDREAWYRTRRPEIMSLFERNVFGRTPAGNPGVHWRVESAEDGALNGRAVRKEVTVFFSRDERGPRMRVLLYVPASAQGPVPVILGLNFAGNHTVSSDVGITLGHIWTVDPATADRKIPPELRKHTLRQADQTSRGKAGSQWQVEKILSHGYALATAYYGDIEPDFVGGIRYGVRPLFFAKRQSAPRPDEWGALGAWAWGLSRAVDYLETDPKIDRNSIVLFGFSRLGKAALWSAAQDERYAAVLSNESGKGGASLYRANSGETVDHLNNSFPHWFCVKFHRYTGHPDRVPVDGNLLLSLIAPRPLYVASAEEDKSSAPAAEFLAELRASRVYRLLGKPGLASDQMPRVNQALTGWLSYHNRSGKHDVTGYDWDQYLSFIGTQLDRESNHLLSMAKP